MQNQAVIQITDKVLVDITMLAEQRNEVLLSDNSYEKNYDGYLTPLTYRSHDDSTYYGIQLPQCFPSMTEPDIGEILEWFVGDGSIVQREHMLLEVRSNYGDIVIPIPPTLRDRYRVVRIVRMQNEQVRMGDLLIILQAIPAHKTAKQSKLQVA